MTKFQLKLLDTAAKWVNIAMQEPKDALALYTVEQEFFALVNKAYSLEDAEDVQYWRKEAEDQ